MDGLYDEPFVVAVWAMAEGQRGADGSQATLSRHRVHIFRDKDEKKWKILIRFKPFEERDSVSEGLNDAYRKFEWHYISRVEVQLFDGEAPSHRINIANWDDILDACKQSIHDNTRRIAAIRARNTIAKKRADAAAAARANPPIPLYEFRGVGETMAQTRARQKAGLPLLNAEGRTQQEEYAVQDARRAALTPAALPL